MPLSERLIRAQTSAPECGSRILAAMASGASIDEIADQECLSPKQVERLPREELGRRWVAPTREYAGLQIVRLGKMSAEPRLEAEKGDLRSSDRVLEIFDRADRHHVFSKIFPSPPELDENIREKPRVTLERLARMSSTNPSYS
jgi:hypothetical protein